MSRQQKRRRLWTAIVFRVNSENLKAVRDAAGTFTGMYQGMLRKHRRTLAKAYFSGMWNAKEAA